MSVWSRATDCTSLRKGVRLAMVGMVAALLSAQVVNVQTATATPLVTCGQECAVSYSACSNLCAAGFTAEQAQCQLQSALCGLQCVLNGYSFGPALQMCQVTCTQQLQLCLQGAVKDNTTCTSVCSTQFSICNLICNLIASLQP